MTYQHPTKTEYKRRAKTRALAALRYRRDRGEATAFELERLRVLEAELRSDSPPGKRV